MTSRRRPLCLGIAGGSGSGKSWLAQYLKDRLGRRATIFCQDWYYRDNGHLTAAEFKKVNVDHPNAFETSLLKAQLRELLSGRQIRAPKYSYADHSRLSEHRVVDPAPLIILDGLLVLHDGGLRRLMDWSVFVDVPEDVRLIRRIRRDVEHRHIGLEETIRLYEHCVSPMHRRFVHPQARHATWHWKQLEEKTFPARLLARLRRKLA